jgi:YHS domain-containing protein
VLIVVGTAIAKEEAKKLDLSKVKCFMTKKAVKEDACVEYGGGKVYFCCNNCKGKFEKDNTKFVAMANHQLALTCQVSQKACPMSGKALDKKTTIKVSDVDVAFCCGNCKKAAEAKTGDDQIDLIFKKEAFEKAFEIAKAEEVKEAAK